MRGLDPRIYQITRRWMLRPRWMLRATPTSLLDVLVEKIHGALPGGLGARFMEAPPLVAMEAVARARIDVNLAVTTTLFLIVSTSVIGIDASWSPKCICVGT